MIAEIVAVGTELLLGDIVDSNSAEIGRVLADLGISHLHRQTVGDNLERLVSALKYALDHSDIVFTIGGLGPTEDDITRDGIAAALGLSLVQDSEIEKQLRELFSSKGLSWTESQLRQTFKPEGAVPIANPNGTAPGLFCKKDSKLIIAMPGPPIEFIPMLHGPIREFLLEMVGDKVIFSRTLRVCGIGEGLLEEKVRDLIHSENPTVAPYAKTGEVHLRLTARAETKQEAEELIKPVEKKIHDILGNKIYGTDGTTLEAAVIKLLLDRGETLTVAESCTGGGLGERLTRVSGASKAFLGGVISYSNAIKRDVLKVSQQTLDKFGAVSEECATEMALGINNLLGSTYAISITGVAGPQGGSKEKPVGLVYIGVAYNSKVQVMRHHFLGDRKRIRMYSVQYALIQLRKNILGL